MITNKTISLSDLLRDFNSGLNKQAEEAAPVEAASTPAPEVCPQCGQSPCACEAPSETDAMQEAAATVDQKQNEAVDAAKVLKNMADEYIAKHDNAIAKEAEVFGEIFAQSAYETMRKQAAAEGAYNTTMDYFEADNDGNESLQKRAEEAYEQAYRYTLCKIAAEEAYAAASPEAAAAQAVSDSASAAKALVEHLTNKGGDSDPESAAGAAAAQAYQETMNQLGGGAQPAAAQAAYDEAAAQMQAAPQADAVAQNAYDTAMQQLQQQAQ